MIHRRDFLRTTGAFGAVLALSQNEAFAQNAPSRLTVLSVPEPHNLVAGLFMAQPNNGVSRNIFDGLVTYDEKTNAPLPELAESWTFSNDRKAVRFKLRRGVKWHDGVEFTSADVTYSFPITTKTNQLTAPSFTHLTAVEAIDKYTVELRFSQLPPTLFDVLHSIGAQILPRHLYEGKDPLQNPLNLAPVGNGPYKFAEWVKGSHVKLVRNPDYWDKSRGLVEEVVFRVLPDAGARVIALEAGEAQFGPATPVPLAEAKRIEADPKSRLRVLRDAYSGNPTVLLTLNLERPVFKDLRARQAIAHAINKKTLADVAFSGFATPATGHVLKSQTRFYTPDTRQYAYDPKLANQLLDEAGLKRDKNGIRFKVDTLPLPYGDDFVRSAQLIQQNLRAVGIALDIKPVDIATWGKRVRDGEFDTTTNYYWGEVDPQLGVFRRFWSKSPVRKGGGNPSAYVSAEMDRLIEAALVELDVDKRRTLIWDIQKLAQQDLPSIALLDLQQIKVVSKSIEGYPVGPDLSISKVRFVGA